MSHLTRLEPPLRRVLAIDAGSRSIRLVLVERSFNRLRLLREQAIDLQEEGLVAPAEIISHFHATLEQWSRPPVALTLPQHLSTSQLLSLPPVADGEVRKLIEEETRRLGGVSESAILYDFVRVEPGAGDRQQYWVTLCQEGEIREQINRLGLDDQAICEVTTTANALVTAFCTAAPGTERAVLVHAGAQSTVVVILLGGHAVFAGSFPVGGDFFTRALASQLKCSLETAEDLKRTKELLRGAEALPGFASVVDGWLAELLRQLQEWSEQHAGAAPSLKSFAIFVSGGVFAQPGLLAHLDGRSGLRFQPWPATGAGGPGVGFEVAYGTALQALGRSPQPASLLPPDRRAAWERRVTRQLVDFASAVLLAALFVLLVLGTWQQSRLIGRKTTLLARVQTALGEAQTNEVLTDRLLAQYDQLRPLLEDQQRTMNTLQTLALLQDARSNRSYWYVLFADRRSYFSLPVPGTNQLTQTNFTGLLRYGPASLTNLPASVTNLLPVTPGFIAELCVPEDADPARRSFSQLVSDLKQDPLFARVDSLSEDLRRNLADPKVLLPDRHFALSLELADAQWELPAPVRRRLLLGYPNAGSRAAGRPSKAAESESAIVP